MLDYITENKEISAADTLKTEQLTPNTTCWLRGELSL